MAAVPAESKTNSPVSGDMLEAGGLRDNPIVRQLAVMIGIAVSVAIGVAVVLWSQTPSYSILYANLADKDAVEVLEALQQANIPYKVDQGTGAVMVPSGDIRNARMQLASAGLPRSQGMGFELMQQDSGFGTSRLVEQARYQRALEGELARTISTITAVQTARVHVAAPKQSVFVRKRKQPSASVVLKLYSGRTLEQGQVESIIHLVASSVPELEPGRVTVVDHKGRLLSEQATSREMQLTSSQFEYTKQLEDHYQQRIYDILVPILGEERVRTQVTADVDFTVTEQTQERYNPDQPALRSEQVNEQSSRLSEVQGVPGALTNQPPAAGTAPQVAGDGQGDGEGGQPLNSSRRATRNFELDKTVSHTRLSPISLRRLSVAVVVDDKQGVDAEGKPVSVERTPEEIERITALVREAIGFDVTRGDSVRVVNTSFMEPEAVEPLPEPPMWEEAWFWDIVKQVGGVLLVLLLIFVVLRPTLKKLTTPTEMVVAGAEGGMAAAGAGGMAGEGGGLALGADGQPVHLPGPGKYENVLEAARRMVDEDPKRVAQLVKTWVGHG